MSAPTPRLDQSPKFRRLQLASGLAALPADAQAARVDRTGGLFGAGIIRGVSVLTRGEALGHGFWCDSVMLDQCLAFANAEPRGLKCRFTHPGLSADGLSKGLGLLTSFRRVGDQIIADQNFYQSAHKSPDGDLAGYVMDRAEEDPEHFGTSIVFEADWEAEDLFLEEHEQKVEETDRDGRPIERYRFISPDELNTNNLPHARIAELRACDVVDDPAANPSGLFHRDLSVMNDATAFLDHVLGVPADPGASPHRPSLLGLDVDPERARQFVQRYAQQRGIDLASLLKGTAMTTKTALDDAPKTEAPAADPKPECTCPKADTAASDKPAEDPKAELGRFVTLFGKEKGTDFYLAGTTFEAAKDQHIAALSAENKSLKERLASLGKAGTDPVGFSPAADPDRKPSGKTAFQSLFKQRGTVPSN